MRNAALILFFVAFGYAAKSQRFTLLPQVGFENSKTTINYNDLSSFSPFGVKFTPQASLRLNYSSKAGHGFYIGAATSRSMVSFSFADPETANKNYTATTGDLKLRLEGGYQFNTKAISLGKPKSSSTTATEKKKTCGSRSSHCCSRSGGQKQSGSRAGNNSSWMRIQPSVGMAFVPGVKPDVSSKMQGSQTIYEYKAGNWNTAVMAGTAFEFGRGSTRQFTLSVNYFKALGHMSERTISSISSGKEVNTSFSSASSGWDVRIGIPFTLKAKKHSNSQPHYQRSGCGQYRPTYRCMRYN